MTSKAPYYIKFKPSKKDYIFFVIAFLIIGILSYLLYKDIYATYVVEEEPIGKIVFKKRTALRKLQTQNLWELLQNEYPVYNGDSIKTEEFSEAVLKLKDGTEIALNENSFIVINFTKEETKIDFNYGSLETKTAETNVKVKTGDSEIDLKSAEAKITNTKESVNIQLQQGKAEFIKEGKKEEIKKDEVLIAQKTEDKIVKTKMKLNLIKPLEDERFFTTTKDKVIEFEYQGDPEINYELWVSMNSMFRPTLIKIPIKRIAQIQLKPGTYYWKIVEKNQDHTLFPYRKFVVFQKEKPQLFTPKNLEIFKTKTELNINFSWSKLELAKGYELLIDTNPNFTNPKRISTFVNNVNVPIDVQTQTYYWKVIALGVLEELTETSDVQSFQIQELEKFKPAKLISPLNEYFLHTKTKNYVFKWWVDSPNKQTIQIAKDSKFNEILFEQSNITVSTFDVKREFPTGTYYWRIINEDKIPSDVGTFFVIETPRLTLSFPRNNELFLFEDAKEIPLKWSYELREVEFIVSLAKEPNFQKPLLTNKTLKEEFLVPSNLLNSEGEYFWRVDIRKLNTNDVLDTQSSKFFMYFLPKPTRIIIPKNNETFNLLSVNQISIQWERAKHVDYYEYELLKAGTPILKNRTNQNQVVLTNLEDFGIGVYDFRVKGVRKIQERIIPTNEVGVRFVLEYQIQSKPEFLTPERIVIE
ncbi:MAG: FecR family protein [Leptospiraceae bacterium]|nr:FecR family protein [Leptospiraceae bacterium]MDW7975935.1 FecR domain-containing protein [Leptospiraceae bacterium]